MKAKKVLAMTLATAMTVGMLAGCGSTGEKKESGSDSEQITLNYWTWFPSKDQIQETVDAFEKENPNIKINMTVMESKAFQEKVPLALRKILMLLEFSHQHLQKKFRIIWQIWMN